MKLTSARPSYERIAFVLGVLRDVEALKIFNEASKGFKSGKETVKELKLTPRKYYRTLNELTQAGILEASGNTIKLTSMGKQLHSFLFCGFESILASNRSPFESLPEIGSSKLMVVINDYDKLIHFMVEAINKSKSEILLATRFVDLAVIQSLTFALERKIKLKTLNDTNLDYPTFFKLIVGTLRNFRPNISKFFVDAENSYRSVAVPLSFIIIDGELALFEIPNKQFKTAFVSMDKEVVGCLSAFFVELWNQSASLNVPNSP